MMLLITHQPFRLGEGNHCDRDAAPIELGMLPAHLAEVRLARQSCQVTQKNQQEISVELLGKIDGRAMKIQQRQLF
jgi:hypothetical protein